MHRSKKDKSLFLLVFLATVRLQVNRQQTLESATPLQSVRVVIVTPLILTQSNNGEFLTLFTKIVFNSILIAALVA